MDKKYDIVIIGGGAGGLFAASVANALGAKACIIEKTRLGGDCTWTGCVPSKTLLKAAQVARWIRDTARYGIELSSQPSFRIAGVMDHVQKVVREIAAHHEPEDLKQRGIDVIFGGPRFTGRASLEVNGQAVTAGKFILCTGSRPAIPPVEGLKDSRYLTYENIFFLKDLPKSLIVLGGGPVGVELSQAFGRLGTDVTLVEMDRVLAAEERELVAVLEESFKEEGIRVISGRKALYCQKHADGIRVGLDDNRALTAEALLVAAGRTANLEGLELDKAGVEGHTKGVRVNAFLQTANPRIFACGDIAGPYQFSHVAAYQAGVCVRNALFRRLAWQKVDYRCVPWATFTDPELAHLGLTEEEARKTHRAIKVYTQDFTHADRAYTDGRTRGAVKVITDAKGLILGAHIVGEQAGELIQGFLLAQSQKIPLGKLARTMYIYPTLSELVKKTAAKDLVQMKDKPLVKLLLRIMKNF